LAARENIWSARWAAGFYAVGSWLVVWLTLQQSAAVLSAGFGFGRTPSRWVDLIALGLSFTMLGIALLMVLAWKWPWARRRLKLDAVRAA
jgi:hypothetical protein